MLAYIFPGQGAQYVGMGKELFEDPATGAKKLYDEASEVLGFDLRKVVLEGTEEQLKETKVTQPAVFVHSYLSAQVFGHDRKPDMVAGHSLGEFTALAVSGALAFSDALSLVAKRAFAMQKACETHPSTMAAVLGLADDVVIAKCAEVTDEVVVAANFNCPGQVVISGSFAGVEKAGELLKAAGAKRVLPLKVGGAFHSPLMSDAREELAAAIEKTPFNAPGCPVYQNVDAQPYTDPALIRENLVRQLNSPVLWTNTVLNMLKDGATEFAEFGPGNVLQGLVKKIAPAGSDIVISGFGS